MEPTAVVVLYMVTGTFEMSIRKMYQVSVPSLCRKIAFSRDRLAIGSYDGVVYIYDIKTESSMPAHRWKLGEGKITSLVFSGADGDQLVAAMAKAKGFLSQPSWHIYDVGEMRVLHSKRDSVDAMAVTSDGNKSTLAVALSEAAKCGIDLYHSPFPKGEVIAKINVGTGFVGSLSFTGSGSLLALLKPTIGSRGNDTVVSWNIFNSWDDSRLFSRLKQKYTSTENTRISMSTRLPEFASSPDGKYLAYVVGETEVETLLNTWEVKSAADSKRKMVKMADGATREDIKGLSFSSDGLTLAVATAKVLVFKRFEDFRPH